MAMILNVTNSSKNCTSSTRYEETAWRTTWTIPHQLTVRNCLFSSLAFQTVEHGFPHQPSALGFSPDLDLLAIGTRSGAIKLYPFKKINRQWSCVLFKWISEFAS